MITKRRFFPASHALGLTSFVLVGVLFGQSNTRPVAGMTLDKLIETPASNFSKVIDNSTSPDKRLAVAVGSVDGIKPAWQVMKDRDENDKVIVSYSIEPNDCRNYLVDLKADRVIGILDGQHFGTSNHYNHESGTIKWSPDSRWLVEHQHWKWHTATCTIHQLNEKGQLVAKLDFLKTAEEIVGKWLSENHPKMSAEERGRYIVRTEVENFTNYGSLTAWVSGEIPKDVDSEYVNLTVTAKVNQEGGCNLTIEIKQLKKREL